MGIIASIKEIVVLSVESAKEVGNGAEFGATSWLLRRKEREPDERENSPPAPECQIDRPGV